MDGRPIRRGVGTGDEASAGGAPVPVSLDDFALGLARLRAEAGSPSFGELRRRVGGVRSRRHPGTPASVPGLVTVYDLFKTGRRRLDIELLSDVLVALGRADLVAQWRSRYGAIIRELQTAQLRPRVVALVPGVDPPLVGREDELVAQVARLSESGGQLVAVVSGLPGVGTTAYARELLRRVAGRSCGLIIEGHIQGEQSSVIQPQVLAGELLAAAAEHGPGCGFLLDGVPDADYLAAVLPLMGDGDVVVATSRRRIEAPDADVVELQPLSVEEAATLLADRLGGADHDREDLLALARATQGIPLAVNIVASLVGAGPGWSLADHVKRLERETVDLVPGLALTYAGLSEPARQLLRLLAVHPAALDLAEIRAYFGPAAAAAGAEVDADSLAAELEASFLLRRGPDARFGLHDVVRALALRHAWAEEPDSELRTCLASLASMLIDRARAELDAGASGGIDEWVREHLEVIANTAQLAGEFGLATAASAFSELLADYLGDARLWCDALVIHRAAASGGVPSERNRASLRLASVMLLLGLWDQAREVLSRLVLAEPELTPQAMVMLVDVNHFSGATSQALRLGEQALADARDRGDQRTELAALTSMTMLYHTLGMLEEAESAVLAGFDLARELDDQTAAALSWNSLGLLALLNAEPSRALEYAEQATRALPAGAPRSQSAWIRFTSGQARCWLGDPDGLDELVDAYRQLRATRRAGPLEAEVLAGLAVNRLRYGQLDQAEADLRASYRLALQVGSPRLTAKTLNGLGTVKLVQRQSEEARVHFTQALAIARHCDALLEISRAELGLGDVWAQDGQAERAVEAWKTVLALPRVSPVVAQLVVQRLAGAGSSAPAAAPVADRAPQAD